MNVWWRRQKNRLGYRMRMFKCKKLVLILAILLVVFWSVGAYYVRTFRPIFTDVAGSVMTQKLEVAINDAVMKELREEGVTYDNLVITEKNAAGEIASLKANSVLMNLIKAEVANQVIQVISNTDTQDFSIPLGNFFGNEFLSGRGPRIRIKAVPYGTCNVTFNSQFVSAGINQTKLQITMDVKAKVAILPPVGSATYSNIGSSFLIGESVIVGKVPDTFADFDRSASNAEDSLPLLQNAK